VEFADHDDDCSVREKAQSTKHKAQREQFAMTTKTNIQAIEMWVERPQVTSAEEIKPPKDAPLVSVVGICSGGHTVAFHSQRRDGAWPKEANRLEVFVNIGTSRDPAMPSQCEYWRTFVEPKVEVRYDQEADGLYATYYARWVNERGDAGPWSGPACKTIAA